MSRSLDSEKKEGGKREGPVMDREIKWENRFSAKERNLLYLERADYPIWRVIKPVTTPCKKEDLQFCLDIVQFSNRIESNGMEWRRRSSLCPPRGLIFVRYVDVVRWCALFILPLAPSPTLCHSFRNALPGLIQLRSKRRCGSNERLINEICASCSIPLSSATIPDKNMCLFRKYLEILFNELLPLPGGYIRMESRRIPPTGHRLPPFVYLRLSSLPDIPLASVCFSFCQPLVCVFAKNEDFYLLTRIFMNMTKEIWRLSIENCFIASSSIVTIMHFGHFVTCILYTL